MKFPANFLEFTALKEELITKVFPGIAKNYKNLDWISERAILAGNKKVVDSLNVIIQSRIDRELHSYKSVDSVTNENEATNYPTEFLNFLDVSGSPPHNLQLTVGSIIIMLRNLNNLKLCDGTRLSVKKLIINVIKATFIRGKFQGEEILIPQIILTDLSFQIQANSNPHSIGFCDDNQ